jgi:hypothetical protein
MTELTVVEKIAEWRRLKAPVLDSVSSPITPGAPEHCGSKMFLAA